jgi:hypothetical protein
MVSRIEGERLLIAGTVDAVKTGQEFQDMPLHMSLVACFSFPESQRQFLFNAMDKILTHQDYFQHLVGSRQHHHLGDEHQFPARMLRGAEKEGGPSFAFRHLINSLGAFRPDDEHKDTFNPHITDIYERKDRDGKIIVPGQAIAWKQELALPTVALFSAHSERKGQRVLASYSLGKPNRG